jgi:bifunctional non-homologous end joining protein LigD
VRANVTGTEAATTLDIGGRAVRISSPGRLMWPAAGLTKRWLVGYYLDVADAIVPHLRGRPLTLARFPEGTDRRGFLQNECRGAPPWMRTAVLPLRAGERRYCVIDDAASLAWVANLATVELHPYLLDAAAPERPLDLVVDLDPGPGTGLTDCCRLALRLRELLAEAGLDGARAKTSGRAGLHLLAPVAGMTFAQTRALARELAERTVAEQPAAATATQKRSERDGRVLVDWQQNDPRRSTVAAYSLRAGASVPLVSTPLRWDEVREGARDAQAASRLRFGPDEVLHRLDRHGDLFAQPTAS